MLDMSAAFDVVPHSLYLDKLKLYGFMEDAENWMRSYLSDRKQCVYVEGSMSDTLDVESGLPQGSILGPLSWCFFSNELPEVVHCLNDHDDDEPAVGGNNQQVKYHTQCQQCGGLLCFADDSTYSLSRATNSVPDLLSSDLTKTYKELLSFLCANDYN